MFAKLKKLLKSVQRQTEESKVTPARPAIQPFVPTSDTVVVGDEKKSAPTEKKEVLRKSRQGIRILDGGETFEELFDVKDNEPVTQAESPAPKPLAKKSSKTAPRRNKHGFPILDGVDDLATLMGDEPLRPPVPKTSVVRDGALTSKPIKRNKHGIPVLSEKMTIDGQSQAPEESFRDLLMDSLGDKQLEVLLDQKQDGLRKKKPLTLNQKLKAFPLPQGQLDLHGYTSLKAELRAESYIRNAHQNGTHTLRIIVGKGLHSQEGAVLPDVVEKLLVSLKKDGVVLSYDWDRKKKSRSGAVTVYLDNLSFS